MSLSPSAWFSVAQPDSLLAHTIAGLEDDAGPTTALTVRRVRLFGCAAARQVWSLLSTDSRNSVHILERFLYGRASETDLLAAAAPYSEGQVTAAQMAIATVEAAMVIAMASPLQFFPMTTRISRLAARALTTHAIGLPAAGTPISEAWHNAWNTAFHAAKAVQADYVRDLVPPPGYTPRNDPRWLSSTVNDLVRHIDESGDYAAMPILADALEDAGCADEEILRACRSGRPHVRGNWVIDLLRETR